MIEFFVPGVAAPAGSKKAFGFKRRDGSVGATVVDDCKRTKPWQESVRWAATEAYHGPLLTGPLSAEFEFVRLRPKGHYGKKGLNKKGESTTYPTTTPDLLKLARAVEDALTAVVYVDDSQIVTETLRKVWGDAPGVYVTITELRT